MASALGAEGVPVAPPRRTWSGVRTLALPALLLAVAAALGVSTLRSAIVDLRYDLAERVREERRLEEEGRTLTAEVRRLRDPRRLARIARERGFVRPARVIDLPSSSVGSEQP